jgi:hypothetical protein
MRLHERARWEMVRVRLLRTADCPVHHDSVTGIRERPRLLRVYSVEKRHRLATPA